MNEGDIALAPLPQADGQSKNRPVVLLRRLPPFGDFLVCGVSTQLQQYVKGFDEILVPPDTEFAASGLKAASLIRLGFLAVLPESGMLGKIGTLSSVRRQRLLENLCNHLNPPGRTLGRHKSV
jgi:mRNA interferase MazF